MFLCRIRSISRSYGLCDRRALLVGKKHRTHPVGDEARCFLLSGQTAQAVWVPRAGVAMTKSLQEYPTTHYIKVVGSNPASATNIANRKRYRFGKPRNHSGFWVFFAPFFKVQFKRYHFPKTTFGEDLNYMPEQYWVEKAIII